LEPLRGLLSSFDYSRSPIARQGHAARDQPTPNVFGDLARRRFWQLGRVLAVPADPVPPSYWLPDEFDAVRRLVTLLQANPDVGWESRHEFDPPDVVSAVWMVQCVEESCKLGCINTSWTEEDAMPLSIEARSDVGVIELTFEGAVDREQLLETRQGIRRVLSEGDFRSAPEPKVTGSNPVAQRL
jgi:hypothetical protein